MGFYSFPNAVFYAIGTAVPCLRPFSNIKLLQIIYDKDITPRGGAMCFLCRGDSLVLVNNDGCDTLITLTDEEDIKRELEQVRNRVSESHVKALNGELGESLKAGLDVSASDLAAIGFKEVRETDWKLSVGKDGHVTKKVVSRRDLEKIIRKSRELREQRKFRVITAIYHINGHLSFTGTEEALTRAGMELQAPPNELTAGWHYKGNGTGSIIVAADDPVEWIIAIEYLEWKKSSYVRRHENLNNTPHSSTNSPVAQQTTGSTSASAPTNPPFTNQSSTNGDGGHENLTNTAHSSLTNSSVPQQTSPSVSAPTDPPCTNRSSSHGDDGLVQRYMIGVQRLLVIAIPG